MMLLRISCSFALFLAIAANLPLAAAANPTASFQEVYNLIRSNVTGVSEAELNQAAIRGLVNALAPRVEIVPPQGNAAPQEGGLAQSRIFERDIAYLRVASVNDGLDRAVDAAYRTLNATNQMKGVVLDLRYAEGDDFRSAATTADLFVAREQPLLKWGSETAVSRAKTNAISIPVVMLVNRDTAAAAEALAAVLRQSGSGLIIGGKTAGRATVTEEYPLANGSRLRVATQPVLLGNGDPIPERGLTPDIVVAVSEADEMAYYADAFHVVRRTNLLVETSGSVTNGTRRPRFSEAELVREHRGGLDRGAAPTPRERVDEPEVPVVSDPALARAMDLLRGLAVVRQSRL